MKHSHRLAIILIISISVEIIAAFGYWYYDKNRKNGTSNEQTSGSQNDPTVSVKVMSLERKTIKEILVAYGTVVAALGKTQTFSVPFESLVENVLVTTGQLVDANSPLVTIVPSPDTALNLAQARSDYESANASLKLVQQRLEMKLTTQQNLVSEQKKVEAARLKLKSLEDRGIDGRKVIHARSKGLVSQISTGPGQIVAAGATMVEMIGQHEISIRLGIENEDIASLKQGQNVELYPVNIHDKKPMQGNITLITQRINPQTRLVDVFVTPHDDAILMLNEYLEAHVILESREGFVVPRSAVLTQQGDHILYTVQKKHAVRHKVNIGLETPEQVQVLGDDLRMGDQVVTQGNYELHDGMSVDVEPQ